MQIGLIIKKENKDIIECVKQIIELFTKNNVTVLVNSSYEHYFTKVEYIDTDKNIVNNSDVVVTVGGDGTIIYAGKYAAKANKPLIGVNMGRVGFVANLEKSDIELLKNIIDGNYETEKRMLIDCTINSQDFGKKTYVIVNELSLQRDLFSSMVELDIEVNKEKIISYRSDGMIFATATGSTAYSFSAGGPVLEPTMECILLNPICPHTLSTRPVVFSPNSILKAKLSKKNRANCFLSVDGKNVRQIQKEDEIEIKKSNLQLNLIVLKKKNFYTLLNEKLKEDK